MPTLQRVGIAVSGEYDYFPVTMLDMVLVW